ncbi:MAG TPA: FliM/FliN family flagellar motor C-terminal domain-containing protein [Rhodocyclaceae bacterium]|nr:FliM/FliN family flagellar motor C-terminal domain-containing protein [Rhodocyclaceae bacterium]
MSKMNATRSFRLYTSTELNAASATVDAVLQRWATEWFPSARPSNVNVADFGAVRQLQDTSWTPYAVGKSECVLIDKRSDLLKTVANAVAGDAAKHELIRLPLSPILADVVERALSNLVAQLAVAAKGELPRMQTDANADLEIIGAFGSGALLCEFRLADSAVSIVCNIDIARNYVLIAPASKQIKRKLATRVEAISSRSTRTQVVLGHSELAVAELVGLAAGDVILLDRRVGQPFDLCAMDGQLISAVEIGTKGPHVAAAIVRNS